MTDELQQVADEIAENLDRHDVAAMVLLIGQDSVLLEHYGIEEAMRRLRASAGQGLETFKKFVAMKQAIADGNAGDLAALDDSDAAPSDSYLIWSNERGAWWKRRHGYTRAIEEAGRYPPEEALWICQNALMGTGHKLGIMPDLPVREADVRTINERFAGSHPDLPMPWVNGEPET